MSLKYFEVNKNYMYKFILPNIFWISLNLKKKKKVKIHGY